MHVLFHLLYVIFVKWCDIRVTSIYKELMELKSGNNSCIS